MSHQVIVLATSRETKGGITSVVKAHEKGKQWTRYNTLWIATHIDRSILMKVWYMVRGLIIFICEVPYCQIVHIHIGEPPSALRKSVFMFVAKLFQKRTIVHFHSFSASTTIKGNYSFLYKYLFSKADIIIALSNYWKSEINSSYSLEQKVVVIHNPAPNITVNKTEKENIILYAGAICKRKGYEDLLYAFAKIYKQFPNWKIMFAGNGEIERGKKLATKLNIRQQVVFLGWITNAKKDEVFNKTRIFCLPSYAEGFSMAVLDAWSYGLPVITTPVGGIPDVANDGQNMLLFEPGNINQLAQCLERMILDKNLRSEITKASKEFAHKTFHQNTINDRLSLLYESLMEDPNTRKRPFENI